MPFVLSRRLYGFLKLVLCDTNEEYSICRNKRHKGFSGKSFYVTLQNNNNESQVHFFIKEAYRDKIVRVVGNLRFLYTNEIYFYTEIWSRFMRMQSDRSLFDPFNKIAKCFAVTSESGRETIVLEDLKSENFRNHEKRQPYTEEQVMAILKQYGKFHGLSFAYKLLNPQEYSDLTKDFKNNLLYRGEPLSLRTHLKEIYEMSLESLDPERDSEAIAKFKYFYKNMEEILGDKGDYQGDYSVVLHGDCWSNNILFKYNELNELEDIRLIDFQLSTVGSAVYDISYCLYAGVGVSNEVLDNLDFYLKIYHDSLSEILVDFGLDPNVYPFEIFKREWKEFSVVGFTLGLMMWRRKLTCRDNVQILINSEITRFQTMRVQDLAVSVDFDIIKNIFASVARNLILHMHKNDFF